VKKVYEILALNKPIVGQWGIEIEAEGEGMKATESKWWRSEDDGSLRGRFPGSRHEWVLKKPIDLEKVEQSLLDLVKEQHAAKINFSFRTSVHVHMNVQELTFAQVANVLYTYLLLEEPLINYCGESRRGNRFCLRLRDAEGLMAHILNLIDIGEKGLVKIKQDNIRYAAINLEAIKKYGSIEFRGMRGTMDVHTILTWVNLLNSIKQFAVAMEDVEAIHDMFRKLGAKEFMKKVFGPLTKELVGEFERDINYSYSLSLDLPYAYKAFKERPLPPPPIPGVLDHDLPDIREDIAFSD